MTKQPSCKERITEQLKSRIDTLTTLWDAYQSGREPVDDLGYFHEYGLSFDYVTPGTFGEKQREGYFRYQLGYGGPSDEFRFYTGPEMNPHRIEYWFLDWYDGAHRELRGEREKLLLEIFEFFKECGTVEHQYEEALA